MIKEIDRRQEVADNALRHYERCENKTTSYACDLNSDIQGSYRYIDGVRFVLGIVEISLA